MEKKKKPFRKEEILADFPLGWWQHSSHRHSSLKSNGSRCYQYCQSTCVGCLPSQGFWLCGCSQSFCCMLQVIRASLISPSVGTNASDVPLLKGHLKTWHSILCCCNVSFVIAEIPVSYVMLWKLTKVFSRFGRDLCNTLWDVCHIEVVLLSRPFWMLIQQLTTAVHFCVTCWMNLHVNCRPK